MESGSETQVSGLSSVYPDYIDGELRTERERRANLEARGSSVVTQSGGLTTLLIAAAAFVRGSSTAELSTLAVIMVVVSTVLFLASGVLGILVSFPHLYKPQPVADEDTMRKMLTSKRADPEGEAMGVVASIRVGTVLAIRDGNNLKAKLLSAAQITQVIALFVLLFAVLAAIRA